MMKEFKLWHDLTSLVKGASSPASNIGSDTGADIWRYAEPAGKEPDPLKRNVLQWRRLIVSTKDAVSVFAGQPVHLIGYVDRTSVFEPHVFNLARPIIRCCLEDAMPLGLPVFTTKAEQFESDTWLCVKGVLIPSTINQRQVLAIQPKTIKHISKPQKAYINGVF